MSFVISANRLFMLTQSLRLRHILEGKFTVQVLSSPTTTPYHCDVSSETMRMAVDTALAEAEYHPANLDDERAWFMESLEEKLKDSEVVRKNPTVHAELVLIIAKAEGEINNVEPYIGVSKLSCIMCNHYIRAFNKVMMQKIATRGSHGKAYTGWFWPSLPSRDGELRPAFLKLIRQQVRSDFEHHAKTRRLLDSSVGSGFPELDLGPTEDGILKLFEAEE
jgi:OTT_1508-like deaminase